MADLNIVVEWLRHLNSLVVYLSRQNSFVLKKVQLTSAANLSLEWTDATASSDTRTLINLIFKLISPHPTFEPTIAFASQLSTHAEITLRLPTAIQFDTKNYVPNCTLGDVQYIFCRSCGNMLSK